MPLRPLSRRRQAAQFAPPPVAGYAGRRRVLDHNDIDAVILATPGH